MSAVSATPVMVTVLPPAFGPETTSARSPVRSRTSFGTTAFFCKTRSGCRSPRRSRSAVAATNSGRAAFMSIASCAEAREHIEGAEQLAPLIGHQLRQLGEDAPFLLERQRLADRQLVA